MTYDCLNSIPDPDEEFWVNSKTFEYKYIVNGKMFRELLLVFALIWYKNLSLFRSLIKSVTFQSLFEILETL